MTTSSARVRMIDVSGKPVTVRVAEASGRITMSPAAARAIRSGRVPKGNVLAVARVASIMGAKRVSETLPLCHPVPLDSVEVDIVPGARAVTVRARVRAEARTGVEIEALAAVTAGLLCVYDMVKSLDRGMTIEAVRLEAKSGGRSGTFARAGRPRP
ncbi:MAG: cyclic pyranopterin monophosphate synthase MoaC [Candidatus Coatesbacteria bacterium]